MRGPARRQRVSTVSLLMRQHHPADSTNINKAANTCVVFRVLSQLFSISWCLLKLQSVCSLSGSALEPFPANVGSEAALDRSAVCYGAITERQTTHSHTYSQFRITK